MMYLLNDRARCHGKNCESRDTCERYLQRRTGGPQTPHYENMADGDVCGHYLEAAKKEQGMTDNTMHEGKLWAFLHDSIHEAYKKLRTTGTSNEYHALLDSIASKVADDVDARFLQVAQSVPVVGEPVAWVNINKHGDITRTVIRRDKWCTTPVYRKPTNSIPAAELATLRKDAEKRDAREDRHWRAGFMDGWNAGVIGDESALKAAGERLDAAIAQEPKK